LVRIVYFGDAVIEEKSHSPHSTQVASKKLFCFSM